MGNFERSDRTFFFFIPKILRKLINENYENPFYFNFLRGSGLRPQNYSKIDSENFSKYTLFKGTSPTRSVFSLRSRNFSLPTCRLNSLFVEVYSLFVEVYSHFNSLLLPSSHYSNGFSQFFLPDSYSNLARLEQ